MDMYNYTCLYIILEAQRAKSCKTQTHPAQAVGPACAAAPAPHHPHLTTVSAHFGHSAITVSWLQAFYDIDCYNLHISNMYYKYMFIFDVYIYIF